MRNCGYPEGLCTACHSHGPVDELSHAMYSENKHTSMIIELSILNQFLSLKLCLDVEFAYTMTSLNNNKLHIKTFNYRTKICKMVRNYDILICMIYKYHLRIDSDSKAKKFN